MRRRFPAPRRFARQDQTEHHAGLARLGLFHDFRDRRTERDQEHRGQRQREQRVQEENLLADPHAAQKAAGAPSEEPSRRSEFDRRGGGRWLFGRCVHRGYSGR